jgi:hypothetical protein
MATCFQIIITIKEKKNIRLQKVKHQFPRKKKSYSSVLNMIDRKFIGFSQEKTRKKKKTFVFSLKHSPFKSNFKTINQFTN